MRSLLPITIREKTLEDDSFIHSTWCTCVHDVKPHFYTPWESFCLNQNSLINLIDSVSTTLVACLTEDPDIILGYLTYSHINANLIIHFAYVKSKFRKNKIMSDLLMAADSKYRNKLLCLTNYTNMYETMANRFDLIYDPSIINTLLQIKESHV